jgi:predicted dehydrogenase
LERKLRFGLVGGGEGAFIGQVHRMAAELDGFAELVCGAFSSDPERSRRSGQEIYRLAPERCYGSYADMFTRERAHSPDVRMDFVIIATPNHLHVPVARRALDAGFHVMCDKPLATDLRDAIELRAKVADTGLCFGVTHNYTGYPMIREARELIASGALGEIRRVSCEYLQGWLADEQPGNKQAEWRTDPERAGSAGCFGDIGSHAENLVAFVTGLQIDSLCADLTTFVPGRRLEDDGNVLLRFRGGARGVISASQVAVGKENDLKLQVYGDRGALEWSQTEPNSLTLRWPDRSLEVRRTGVETGQQAAAATRLPPGHPEGYLEAFAELYRNFCLRIAGEDADGPPSIDDGVRGMRFIEQVVASSARGAIWLPFDDDLEETL